jgi:hypothetical protein
MADIDTEQKTMTGHGHRRVNNRQVNGHWIENNRQAWTQERK